MSISVCPLSSGSKGNATLVMGECKLLVDNGLPLYLIEKRLSEAMVSPAELSGILITHRHSDHIGGVASFCKKHGVRVYVAEEEQEILLLSGVPYSLLTPFSREDFYVDAFNISPFALSHDVPCFGFSIYSNGKKATILTDLGVLPSKLCEEISDSDIVMIEANHDTALLRSNRSYSAALKRRISSAVGHLSNDACADAVALMAKRGLRQVILAHLSEENNYPELAFSAVASRLKRDNIIAGKDIRIGVAAQMCVSPLFKAV